MEKTFYGVTLIVKTDVPTHEQADAYISDAPTKVCSDQTQNKFHRINLNATKRDNSQIFENIFRRTLEALLRLDKSGNCTTVAIEKLTQNTGSLNNYQIIRAMLCGMYGFCQITCVAACPILIHKTAIKKITLFIPPEDLSVAEELDRTDNFKNFTDMYAEPRMQEILDKEYLAGK